MTFTHSSPTKVPLLVSILLYSFLTCACSNESIQQNAGLSSSSPVAGDTSTQTKPVINQPLTSSETKVPDNKFIKLAKKATTDYQLTQLPLECLDFELQDKPFEGKFVIDARETHSKTCNGDPNTSPRLYSIAIDDTTGQLWSDAKSLLGQMELLNKSE